MFKLFSQFFKRTQPVREQQSEISRLEQLRQRKTVEYPKLISKAEWIVRSRQFSPSREAGGSSASGVESVFTRELERYREKGLLSDIQNASAGCVHGMR